MHSCVASVRVSVVSRVLNSTSECDDFRALSEACARHTDQCDSLGYGLNQMFTVQISKLSVRVESLAHSVIRDGMGGVTCSERDTTLSN